MYDTLMIKVSFQRGLGRVRINATKSAINARYQSIEWEPFSAIRINGSKP